jgi:DnaK suppressor protein
VRVSESGPAVSAKRDLLARREALAKRYRHLIDVPEREANPEDDADRASDLETETFRSKLSDQEGLELLEIDEALTRIERGDWGTCQQCQEKIEPARLRVLPEARLCVSCAAVENRVSR